MAQRSLYWRLGDLCGIDVEDVTPDGTVIGGVRTRPEGAIDISEQDYQIWQVAKNEAIATARGERSARLSQHRAEQAALRESARAKLVSGDPLTPEEAAILVP